tara:strand:+ start:843 stop:1073 length:231 start_codon:yes stop_codon:yes gene_type:complete
MTAAEATDKIGQARRLVEEVNTAILNAQQVTCACCGTAKFANQTSWQVKQLTTTAGSKLERAESRLRGIERRDEAL